MSHTHDHPHDHPHDHDHDHSHGHDHAHAPDPRVLPAEVTDALYAAQQAKLEQRRAPLASRPTSDIQAAYEQAWAARVEATSIIVSVTEELLARLVASHVPGAHEIVLYEDHSHDAPHGHVKHVLDADGNVLLEGTGDAWHDAGWTEDADEYVWDLHHLDRDGFIPDGAQRLRRIPVYLGD